MPRKVPTKQTTLSLLKWGPVLFGTRLDVAGKFLGTCVPAADHQKLFPCKILSRLKLRSRVQWCTPRVCFRFPHDIVSLAFLAFSNSFSSPRYGGYLWTNLFFWKIKKKRCSVTGQRLMKLCVTSVALWDQSSPTSQALSWIRNPTLVAHRKPSLLCRHS